MEEEHSQEKTAKIRSDRMHYQGQMTWAITIAFILVNMFSIIMAIVFEPASDRILRVIEIYVWFDLVCAGIIGSFFGANVLEYINTKQKK